MNVDGIPRWRHAKRFENLPLVDSFPLVLFQHFRHVTGQDVQVVVIGESGPEGMLRLEVSKPPVTVKPHTKAKILEQFYTGSLLITWKPVYLLIDKHALHIK